MIDFILPVKSTIDAEGVKIAKAYADLPDLKYVDVTDDVNVEELLASDEPMLLWELITLREAPRRPMWDVAFTMGAKTTKDAAGYIRMSLLEAVADIWVPGSDIPVHDYTDDSDTPVIGPKVGYIHVTGVELDPAQHDRLSGIRFIAVHGKALSF